MHSVYHDLKYKLYGSVSERNELFGYNAIANAPREQLGEFFCPAIQPSDIRNGPKDYYYDMRVDNTEKAVIDHMGVVPNLYNDNVTNNATTFAKPNLYKNWQPFTTTAMQKAVPGRPTSWRAHTPCEVARDGRYATWARQDLNPSIYERTLLLEAEENPYAQWYRRQAYLELLALDMPSENDYYTKKLSGDTFCKSLQQHGCPKTTRF